MKKICLVFSLFLVTHFQTQTLTQAFNEPVPGDVDKNYKLDTSAYTSGLPVSITGSNVVWNFTQLSGMFPVVIDSFISPGAATGATAYPGATFSQQRSGVYSFFKSASSPQQTELMGAWSPSLTLTFTNSAIIAGYPVNYGYYLSDPVSGTFKYNTNNGACNGSITISADGLGTVNFPNNVSFQNVLRLKSVEQLTLTSGIIPLGTINQTIYNYYAPGKKFPVLSINYQKYQLIVGTPTITAQANGNFSYFTVAGLEESTAPDNLVIFPNPFHENLMISSPEPGLENEYMICDLNGKLLQQAKTPENLETRKLPPGVYVLHIRNRSGSSSRKIVKE
jgi:hypothetical protein